MDASSRDTQADTPPLNAGLSGKYPTARREGLGGASGGSVFRSKDARLHREAVQFRPLLQAELLFEPSPVRLDGLHAHADAIRDLLIGVALGQESQHFALSPAQVLRPLRLGATRAGDGMRRRVERLREFYKRAPSMDGSNGGQQLRIGHLLDHIPGRSS